MLLECRIDDKSMLIVDAESVGGIDKSLMKTVSHPDKVVGQTVEMIRAVAASFGTAMVGGSADPPSEMRVDFSMRVDSNSVVQISRNHAEGQFRVSLRWSD